MTKTGSIVAVLAGLLTSACVPTSQGTVTTAFIPNSGLPAAAVVRTEYKPDTPNIPKVILFRYYPEKATASQIAAVPENLCKSLNFRLGFTEIVPIEPNHGGPAWQEIRVVCR